MRPTMFIETGKQEVFNFCSTLFWVDIQNTNPEMPYELNVIYCQVK